MQIKYTHKKSKRARRVRLAVYCDGRVVVTSPIGLHQSIVERFVTDKTQWILKKLEYFKNLDNRVIRRFTRKDYLENKERAREFVTERISFYNQIYNFSFNRISIRNQKTCWGSCSRQNNLNLNYKILFLPKEQQNYIIVHELCHLKEFNHSKEFWKLVEKAVPNYLKIKKELRKQELLYR